MNLLIEILRYPTEEDWKRCKMLALNTVWKSNVGEVTEQWKYKILKAEHSPIRTLMFTIKMEIPYFCSVHLVRHKFGAEHYVSSQRNDRQDMYDRNEARQDATVVHIMDINAEALINMSHRRLCFKADPKTQEIMSEIRAKVLSVSPEIGFMMCPMCEYRKGCNEIGGCGWYDRSRDT